MKLYVVRHAQTDWNAKGYLQGNTDISLNEIGKMQAKRIQKEVSDIHFDICFSSPLSRVYDTASIICNNQVKIVIDDRLIERELGNLEGKPFMNYDTKMYWDYKLNATSSGVEGIQDMFSRVTSFYNELVKKHSNDTVLLVAHGAVIRVLHHIITGYDENTDFLKFDVPNCHVFSYEI